MVFNQQDQEDKEDPPRSFVVKSEDQDHHSHQEDQSSKRDASLTTTSVMLTEEVLHLPDQIAHQALHHLPALVHHLLLGVSDIHTMDGHTSIKMEAETTHINGQTTVTPLTSTLTHTAIQVSVLKVHMSILTPTLIQMVVITTPLTNTKAGTTMEINVTTGTHNPHPIASQVQARLVNQRTTMLLISTSGMEKLRITDTSTVITFLHGASTMELTTSTVKRSEAEVKISRSDSTTEMDQPEEAEVTKGSIETKIKAELSEDKTEETREETRSELETAEAEAEVDKQEIAELNLNEDADSRSRSRVDARSVQDSSSREADTDAQLLPRSNTPEEETRLSKSTDNLRDRTTTESANFIEIN